jgi:starch synthase
MKKASRSKKTRRGTPQRVYADAPRAEKEIIDQSAASTEIPKEAIMPKHGSATDPKTPEGDAPSGESPPGGTAPFQSGGPAISGTASPRKKGGGTRTAAKKPPARQPARAEPAEEEPKAAPAGPVESPATSPPSTSLHAGPPSVAETADDNVEGAAAVPKETLDVGSAGPEPAIQSAPPAPAEVSGAPAKAPGPEAEEDRAAPVPAFETSLVPEAQVPVEPAHVREWMPPPVEEPEPSPLPEPPAPPTWEPPVVEEPAPPPEPVPEPVSHYDVAHVLPNMPSMFIVHITPELAPVAKVGGLADVVFGLSRELEYRGSHVEIILPKYDCMRYDHIWGLCETLRDLWVPWYGGAIHCSVYFGFVHGRKCFFIEPHSQDNFFNRGYFYGGFKDDIMRFAFFSRAAMEFLLKAGKQPDIIHCHDWQTALVPVFLYEIYKFLGMGHPRVCFTIHNFQHQGVTGAEVLRATGLNRPEYYLHYDRLLDNRYPNALNLTKGGVVYSNFITTVSPRHASEAKDQGQGFGLESTLHIHHAKYGGVVNGVDYDVWNPEIDRYIPFHYNADSIADKYRNKRALRERLWLADNEKPVVAFIGRLDPQKGLELIRHALFYTLQAGGQFVLLGSSADNSINGYFWSLKHQLNDNPDCHLEIGFNDELSHLIYAGADMMLVPSRFEPCGLTQLISMRYGTIPIVREVGGLADTVFDKDYSWKPFNERNGYVFKDYDDQGLESALGRAISCYYQYPDHFRELMKNAMRYDYSWKYPGQDYLNIYDYIREK